MGRCEGLEEIGKDWMGMALWRLEVMLEILFVFGIVSVQHHSERC